MEDKKETIKKNSLPKWAIWFFWIFFIIGTSFLSYYTYQMLIAAKASIEAKQANFERDIDEKKIYTDVIDIEAFIELTSDYQIAKVASLEPQELYYDTYLNIEKEFDLPEDFPKFLSDNTCLSTDIPFPTILKYRNVKMARLKLVKHNQQYIIMGMDNRAFWIATIEQNGITHFEKLIDNVDLEPLSPGEKSNLEVIQVSDFNMQTYVFNLDTNELAVYCDGEKTKSLPLPSGNYDFSSFPEYSLILSEDGRLYEFYYTGIPMQPTIKLLAKNVLIAGETSSRSVMFYQSTTNSWWKIEYKAKKYKKGVLYLKNTYTDENNKIKVDFHFQEGDDMNATFETVSCFVPKWWDELPEELK